MCQNTLILNTDELLFDFYTKKQQLWQQVSQRENIEVTDKFFMALYDAHLEKQEKIAREYRSLAPFMSEVNHSFHLWLQEFTPKIDQATVDFVKSMERQYRIIWVTNQKLELAQKLLSQFSFQYESLYSTKNVLNAKPEPDIYLKIARALKIKANELHIVDSTLNGVQASYLAHAKGIFLEQFGPPSLIIRKFSTTIVPDLEALSVHLLTLSQNA